MEMKFYSFKLEPTDESVIEVMFTIVILHDITEHSARNLAVCTSVTDPSPLQ